MNWSIAMLAMLMAPPAEAGACSAPPVQNSEQALCYAAVYADKNGLAHGSSFSRRVTKGRTGWTVRFTNTRTDARGSGWEVDVDTAAGTVSRFTSFKGDASAKDPRR